MPGGEMKNQLSLELLRDAHFWVRRQRLPLPCLVRCTQRRQRTESVYSVPM